MNEKAYLLCLESVGHPVDAVLDTDAYNEIDDQFALAYMVRSRERIHVKAIYAAPFHNARSASPADGMEKSFGKIRSVLSLMGEELLQSVRRGSEHYLKDERTPVLSDVALYAAALQGDADCGGLWGYGFTGGEPLLGLSRGVPLLVRPPGRGLTLANLMKTLLFSAVCPLVDGMDLLRSEGLRLDTVYGHGGADLGKRLCFPAAGQRRCGDRHPGYAGRRGYPALPDL